MSTEADYLEPLKETLLRLDDKMEERGWGQPSELSLVLRKDFDSDRASIRASIIGMLPYPNWDLVANRGAQEAIALLVVAAEEAPACPLPHFYGIGYTAEAWTLTATGPERAAYRGQIKDHPDRIECRVSILAPALGEPLMAQRIRGKQPEVFVNERDGMGVGGAIPKLLSRLAAATAL